jgi:hypothetical protein
VQAIILGCFFFIVILSVRLVLSSSSDAIHRHAQVLVTQAERLSDIPRRLSAHRFLIDESGFIQPLEFSTDIKVFASNKRFAKNESLSQEISEYITGNDFSSSLGVAIYPRAGASERATAVFLEETKFSDRTSVVHLLPRLPRAVGRAIPTLWTFGSSIVGCCTGRCVAYCIHGSGSFGSDYCGHRREVGGHMICV